MAMTQTTLTAVDHQAPVRETFADWVDRQAGRFFLMPAVLIILVFSIFPLIISLLLSFSSFRLALGGYKLTFVGMLNYNKLLWGTQQFHFIGTVTEVPWYGWVIFLAVAAACAWLLVRYLRSGRAGIAGTLGRLVTMAFALAVAWMLARTIGPAGLFGTVTTTLFYVICGVALQFAVGLGLALLCANPVKGKAFFRVVFFIPLMVTPVGIAYTFRMLADTAVGPFAPIWRMFGLAEASWSAQPWSARLVVLVGDSWQWIPFIFIVMLAAVESQPRDSVEAAELDGASKWQIFRDITWPSIAPVAATVVLIRSIEAFKIIDLPNILTNGGPGIATESLTLHAFSEWRALNLGGSAAVAYTLLIISTIVCVSFFNFVAKPLRESRS
jgi:multiple sugar transport system permease protein